MNVAGKATEGATGTQHGNHVTSRDTQKVGQLWPSKDLQVASKVTRSDVLRSLEHGRLPVHDLDGLGMLRPAHQFRGLQFGRHRQSPSLVRHLYVLPLFAFWTLLTAHQPCSRPLRG